MLPQDVHIKGRNLEILPEWQEKIEEELARLQKHSREPILHARVEIIGTAHHRHGAFEVHLAANVTGKHPHREPPGENVMPSSWRPSTPWTGASGKIRHRSSSR